MGLGARWHEIAHTYADVNMAFGDIVKVTPSSKVVGDMAIVPGQPRHDRRRVRAPRPGSQSHAAQFRGGDVCGIARRARRRLAAEAAAT